MLLFVLPYCLVIIFSTRSLRTHKCCDLYSLCGFRTIIAGHVLLSFIQNHVLFTYSEIQTQACYILQFIISFRVHSLIFWFLIHLTKFNSMRRTVQLLFLNTHTRTAMIFIRFIESFILQKMKKYASIC